MESQAKQLAPIFNKQHAARVQVATRRLAPAVQWRLFVCALLVNDFVAVGAGFLVAYWIRFDLHLPIFRVNVVPEYPFYRTLSLILMLIWLIIFAGNGLYQRQNLLGGFQEYSRVFRATSTGLLLVIVAGFVDPGFILARGWLFLAWILVFLFVSGGRFMLRRVVYALRRHGYFLSPTLIVGANGEGLSLAAQLSRWQTSGLHVVGFVDDGPVPEDSVSSGFQTLGATGQLDQLIGQHNVEELILATSALTRQQIVDIFSRYGMREDLNVRLSSGLFEIITTGLEVKEMAYVPLVRVNKVRLTGADHILKLILDYSIALPGLIAIAPFLLVIAIVIKLDSPGPILYRRRVMGINGKQFDAYKFRTMRVNGDEILARHPELQEELRRNHKLKNDPRITRVGHFLRKYSLDELPQLLNVLKREMSLVGPRMIAPEEMEMYEQWGMNLLTVPPGITGLWQVSGRSDIAYGERVQLDMQYIRNWSIWLDLQILTQTPMAVIRARGAY